MIIVPFFHYIQVQGVFAENVENPVFPGKSAKMAIA